MSLKGKVIHELKSVLLVTLFFMAWLGILMAIKILILDSYNIDFIGFSKVLISAMILAKVVLILEHVPMGSWLRDKPAFIDVLLRTLLYATGTLVVLILEKAFESRHEHGGIGPAMLKVFQQRDIPHMWANTIAVTFALFFYNLLSLINRHVGSGGLFRVMLSPPPSNIKTS
jgi:hypothetical protein